MTELMLSMAFWLTLVVFGASALRVLLVGAGIGLNDTARCGLCSTPTPLYRAIRCPTCHVPTARAGIVTPLDRARRVSWLGSICASIFLVIVAFAFPVRIIVRAILPDSFLERPTDPVLPIIMQFLLATLTFIACIIINVRRFHILRTSTR